MKAKRFFTGNDTCGRSVERAQSESGKWFQRSMEYNGYGKALSSWSESKDMPTFETHGTNQYSGEKFKYDKPVCMWGWNKMTEHDEIPRLRLPS